MTPTKTSLRHLPLERLTAHADNRPLDRDKVREMADSIRQHGILTPLIVTEHLTDYNRWIILDGQHRAAAARLVGKQQVLCSVRHGLDADKDEQIIVMLVANCQRAELDPMHRAEQFGVLQKAGLTIEQIATRCGLSPSWVSESLALLDLDTETRERVRAGDVGVGQAKAAVRQVRRAVRTGTPIGDAIGVVPQRRPTVNVGPAHFTRKHPLADVVRASCEHVDASTGQLRPKVGASGCGQCWETAIRADENSKAATPS
ncbi:ParB/RepB/Spo0J family partition protein [Kribbella sp. CA-293567]|uniref:ParB/RepB/Spo0J family partition protein n=1 Tax=Kribbella sp. CA-293567 TaxID=3002436 RepID=UPI0022DD0B32|nr:ParB/RepB/Spo0J family partition protein [Kribbella sp. CA-293567]WBQ02986.1 ParB/RepB/Spo0J family partition protein [Kribbella sp. CA-293567]